MSIPNNVGFVAECLEERPLVRDETGKDLPGEFQVRFKLKLRNTRGKELIVYARLEDPTLREAINTFLDPTFFGGAPDLPPDHSSIEALEARLKAYIDECLVKRFGEIPETPVIAVASTVEELADQLNRDLNGPKDLHDLVVDGAGMGAETYVRALSDTELEVVAKLEQQLAESSTG